MTSRRRMVLLLGLHCIGRVMGCPWVAYNVAAAQNLKCTPIHAARLRLWYPVLHSHSGITVMLSSPEVLKVSQSLISLSNSVELSVSGVCR